MIYNSNGDCFLIDSREELMRDLKTWELYHFEFYKEGVWILYLRTHFPDTNNKTHIRIAYSSFNPTDKQCEQK